MREILLMYCIILLICIATCSKASNNDASKPALPTFPQVELQAEIARIEPMLAWKDNWPCATLGTECGNGDGFINAGEISTVGTWQSDFVAGAEQSIKENGEPFRSKSHLIDPSLDAGSAQFSRDQALGFILLAKTRPILHDLAQRVYDYAKAHDWAMCADSGACLVTPQLATEWRHVLGIDTNGAEQTTFEVTLLAEAKNAAAGYPQHLVSLDAWFMILSGHNSKRVREVTRILNQRMPNNLWFSTLSKISNGETDFVAEGIALLDCMQRWTRPGLHHSWSASRSDSVCEVRPEGAMGHELVWLAKLLTGEVINEYVRSSPDFDN